MKFETLTLVSILLFSFALSFFINRFVYKKSLKYNLKKSNITGIRWESQSKPIFGGISFYVIFILISLYFIFANGSSSLHNSSLLACILVITISFFMGLADDILNTSPYFKFLIQIMSATILIFFGLYIDVSSSMIINYAITYLWVIGIMNSINMLDNMDAISSVVTTIILIGIFISSYILPVQQNSFVLLIIVSTIGSLLSFLVFYNWNPSKMYMGDNGSQFIGSLLAIAGIVFVWNTGFTSKELIVLKPFFAILLAFLIPIVDTTTVTINRLLKKKSPFIGGKDHTTHHLSYLGLSEKKIALIFGLISAIAVTFSILIIKSNLSKFYSIMIIIFALIIFSLLYINTKISKPS